MMSITLLVVLFLFSFCNSLEQPNVDFYDYCVVGAGPAGLQMGYFLEKSKKNYIIFEKGESPGTFFKKYPIHRTLISINKLYTGRSNKEFNFRHDWNSLLSDDNEFRLTKYSQKFFPEADSYVSYLRDYSSKLHIKYRTKIMIKQTNGTSNLILSVNDGQQYICNTTIVATGLVTPISYNFSGSEVVEGYEDLTLNTSKYVDKSVLILGKGNSAFEVADYLTPVTRFIHMLSRSQVKLAWATHYVGDLRAINNGLLDTYQLKSLNGVLEADVRLMSFRKNPVTGRYTITDADEKFSIYDNDPTREGYDHVIRCLGFKFDFSIFDHSMKVQSTFNYEEEEEEGKYPAIRHDYRSVNIPHLYFAGTITHSLDHRKSAGGFIHGFRYTTQTLYRLLDWNRHANLWPHVNFMTILDVIPHLVKRLNEASDIYQMFGVLCEVIILSNTTERNITYLEGFPCELVNQIHEKSGHKVDYGIIIISLEYGKNYSGVGKDVFHSDRASVHASEGHQSNFLHPVLYYYKMLPTQLDMETRPVNWILPVPDKLHHVVEDFTTVYDAEKTHLTTLRQFFESILREDLRHYFAEQCMVAALTNKQLPYACRLHQYHVQPSLDIRKTLCGMKSSTLRRVPTLCEF